MTSENEEKEASAVLSAMWFVVSTKVGGGLVGKSGAI